MFTFTHAGKIGDIFYSLHFCRELSARFHHDKFNFNLQINKKPSDFCKTVPGERLLSQENAEFIKPLLESQPFIHEVTICESPEKTKDLVDLNIFRCGLINQSGSEIRDWYYSFCVPTLPREFWKPVLHVEPNPKYKDKVLFSLSERYVNVMLDYRKLEQFRDHMVFIGTDSEHRTFQEKYFELDRVELTPEDSLLTVAQYLAGAKGFLSNQSGFFSLAEGMKINRILLLADWIKDNKSGKIVAGPKTNLPLGGWCNSVSFTPKMIAAMKELVEMKP